MRRSSPHKIPLWLIEIWLLLFTALPPSRASSKLNCQRNVDSASEAVVLENERILGPIKAKIADPGIPSVSALHLGKDPPQIGLSVGSPLSPGLSDPLLEEARTLKIVDDFKILSDARPRALSLVKRDSLCKEALRLGEAAERGAPAGASKAGRARLGRKAFLRAYLKGYYQFGDELYPVPKGVRPRWKVRTPDADINAAFAYTERLLPELVRRTPKTSSGSLLPSPYPVLIAAPGRFHESYYWDSYFGLKWLLSTGRLELAQGVVEDFLHAVQQYGHVPNGMRDYYLSRSQPPFLSSMIRDGYDATVRAADAKGRAHALKWLRARAYPLLKRDYEDFWMAKRYDKATGLSHSSDLLSLPRPERHGNDDEKKLGETYRDVRAACESGLDFTEALQGQASQIAGVLLNSMLYKTELDLAWMAQEVGDAAGAARDLASAEKRKQAISRYLWDPTLGQFENYNLKTKKRVPVLTANTFVPLFVKLASPEQAAAVHAKLPRLERAGGLMASELTASRGQWDGDNGWAPQQVMAIQGLMNYGPKYEADAKRLARKWVDMIAKVYKRNGVMFERYDVVTRSYPPSDTSKYPVQPGFLWTSSSYVWALTKVLGVKLLE